MVARKYQVFQIYYDEESRQQLDAGFLTLDNRTNERADWREYWPIRRYLLNEPLDEAVYYGFFSPRFGEKTGLDSARVFQFLDGLDDSIEVALFSPYWDYIAEYWNVIEQGEVWHPGFRDICLQFLASAYPGADPLGSPNNAKTAVFGNFFVARPRFWRRWLNLCGALFDQAENSSGGLSGRLNDAAFYRIRVEFKVFLMERMASIILANEPGWKVAAFNPFRLNPSPFITGEFAYHGVICDALKIAYQENGYQEYKNAYNKMRESIKTSITGRPGADLRDAFTLKRR